MNKSYLKLISILLIIAVSFLYVNQARAGFLVPILVAIVAAIPTATTVAVATLVTGIVASFNCETSPFTGFSCGHDSGLLANSNGLGCIYEGTFTFYNPQMNYGYIEQIPYVLYQDSGCTVVDSAGSYYIEVITDKFGEHQGCAPAPTRYTDAECKNAATNGFYVLKSGDKFGSTCTRDTILVSSSNVNDDASKDVAIYRFTLPGDISSGEMSDWFFSLSGQVGSGFISMTVPITDEYRAGYPTGLSGYWDAGGSSQSNIVATIPYSQICSGNVCEFIDNTVPEDSYIVYAAKILGDFESAVVLTWADPGYDPKYASAEPNFVVLPNKFLNAGGASPTRFPPFLDEAHGTAYQGGRNMSLYDGNPSAKAFLGPYKTDVCPEEEEEETQEEEVEETQDADQGGGQQLPDCDFTADPASIVPPQFSTLWWDCVYADYCEIDQGIGSVDFSSSIEVSPTQTTTYTLLCDGEGGSASFPITVIVGFTSWLKEILPK